MKYKCISVYLFIFLFTSLFIAAIDEKNCDKIINDTMKIHKLDAMWNLNKRIQPFIELTNDQFKKFNYLINNFKTNLKLNYDLERETLDKIEFEFPDSNELFVIVLSIDMYKKLLKTKCINKTSDFKKIYSNIFFSVWDLENIKYGVSVFLTKPKTDVDYNFIKNDFIKEGDFFMDKQGRIWLYDKNCK